MSVLFDYFLAPDDATAAATIDWPGGPGSGKPKKGPFGKAVPPFDVLSLPGIDPAVMLGTLEELLTGTPFADQLADKTSRQQVAIRDGGERLVLRVYDKFTDALATADPAQLAAVAVPWSQTEEFWGQGDPTLLTQVLQELSRMCAQGTSTGTHLYCWICV